MLWRQRLKQLSGWVYKPVRLVLVTGYTRLTPNDKAIPVRVFISSDNSLTVHVHMYQEVEDPKTGEVSKPL